MNTQRSVEVRGAPRFAQPLDRVAFVAVVALLFVAGTVATIDLHASMSAMPGTPMPGGWTLAPIWTRPCGRTWFDAGASFVAMWAAMMVPMMLPSVAPALWRYRTALAAMDKPACVAHRVAMACAMYFIVWAAVGMVVFPVVAAATSIELRMPALARAAPAVSGIVVLAAGAFQLAAWTTPCRARDGAARQDRRSWRYGLRLGLDGVRCCAAPMIVLLVAGMMEPCTMIVATAAMTLMQRVDWLKS